MQMCVGPILQKDKHTHKYFEQIDTSLKTKIPTLHCRCEQIWLDHEMELFTLLLAAEDLF